MGRVLVAGIVGGIVVFCWGYVAHMLLPLGDMGIRQIPKEEGVVGPMKDTIHEPGLYFFPGRDMSKEMSAAEFEAHAAKIKAGPTGLLVIHPEGGEAMSPKQLGTEFGTNVVCAFIAAIVLSQIKSPYPMRVLCVTLMGLFGFLMVCVPYWNWYGFPLDFTEGQGASHVAGWFLAGLVMAAIVRPAKEKGSPVPV
jgi:hypothetical protein